MHEANRILLSTKAAFAADGFKLPSSAETDGLMMLLGRLDAEKFLAPKIKRAKTYEKNSAAFDRAAKLIAFFRALDAVMNGLNDAPVTAMSLTLLNKALWGDLEQNAGKPRTKEALDNGSAHTDPKYISGSLKAILAKMNEIVSAPQTSKDDFAGYLSHYMRELVILHPFECGSEITVRVFAIMFGRLKGFSLSFSRVPASTIKNAEMSAFLADDVTPLFKLFAECLSYDHKTITQSASPRTRREVANELSRPTRAPKPIPAERKPAPKQKTQKQKPDEINKEEVLKRAVRLQQKISKLNEQLTELIQPLEDNDTDEE